MPLQQVACRCSPSSTAGRKLPCERVRHNTQVTSRWLPLDRSERPPETEQPTQKFGQLPIGRQREPFPTWRLGKQGPSLQCSSARQPENRSQKCGRDLSWLAERCAEE